MPVATPEQYAEMLDRAKAGGFAYPAFNVSSSQTINSVLQGLTEAGSDGIIQVTTGGADYFAGHTVKARATGALAFARYATEVAKNYPVTVALHTDHCPKDALADHDTPPEVDRAEERAHGVDRGAVGCLLGTAADEGHRPDRGRFGRADQLHREVAVGTKRAQITSQTHHAATVSISPVQNPGFRFVESEGIAILNRAAGGRAAWRHPDGIRPPAGLE